MAELLEKVLCSSADGSPQPLRYWIPSKAMRHGAILIALHTWSFDYQADLSSWFAEAQRRGWMYLQPNFRGPNWAPQACGSQAAMRDIIDALDWVLADTPRRPERIYLAGASGGGHMALQAVAHFPERFTAVSVWCGITDLALWHQMHSRDGLGVGYGEHIEKVVGGPPGASPEVNRELWLRSPIHHLHQAWKVPLDINHGIHDGHRGAVPLHHSVQAFNVIARAWQVPPVSEDEQRELWSQHRLSHPRPSDVAGDPSYERSIYLRRYAGSSRLTIFDGGHEWNAVTACHWLAQQAAPGLISDPAALPVETAGGATSTIAR